MTNLFSPLRARLGRAAFGLLLAPLLAGASLAESTAPSEAVAAARALLPAKYRDAGVLNVGASTVYAPHSFFKDGTKEWTGYELDLFNAVANVLDIKVEYTEAPFQQLIAGVKSGRSDVSIGDLGDNDLRREQVDFIDYGLLTFQLVVDKGNPENIKSVFDVCGRDLGVVQGTTNIIANALKNCEAKGFKPANFVEFPDQTAKDQAIQSGRLPRVDIAATAVSRYKQANGLSPNIELIPSDDLGNLYIGAIVDKGNTELANAIHAAVQVLFDNGTYAEILAKWNISDLALKAPGVNIGQEATNWVQPKK